MKNSMVFGGIPNILLALNITHLLKFFLYINDSLTIDASRVWHCVAASFEKESGCSAC